MKVTNVFWLRANLKRRALAAAFGCGLILAGGITGFPPGPLPAAGVESSVQIPPGTVLPVRLGSELTLKKASAGENLEALIMQEVPLPGGEKIPWRTRVKGSVVSVVKDGEGTGGSLTLKFDRVEDRKQEVPIQTSLRAIASFNAVRSAAMPLGGQDIGTPTAWQVTMQIGGDVRYGDGGEVRNQMKQRVGKGVRGGVLVHVRANPARDCSGSLAGDDRLQALWVFSADACGVYDLKGIRILSDGKAAPRGEITLHFEKEDTPLYAQTGILLRTIAEP